MCRLAPAGFFRTSVMAAGTRGATISMCPATVRLAAVSFDQDSACWLPVESENTCCQQFQRQQSADSVAVRLAPEKVLACTPNWLML